MPTTALHHRYVAEAVWLPTYIGLTMLILGGITNTAVASIVLLVSLLASRMLLELIYRMTFGDARLHLRIQLAAFAFQAIIWIALWGWHAHRTSAA